MAANSVFIFPGGLGGGISPVNPSLFPNGSAAAPSISFINDPQSGRYLIGTDNVGESINGSLVFDWNATRFRTSLPIYLPDGAVGAPALAFENDATSGRYRIGNDNFGESVNGVLAFDWNATRLLSALNVELGATKTLGWSDVILKRGGANILDLVNGTNAQSQRIFRTTDGTNFSGLQIRFSGSAPIIETFRAGTEAAQTIVLRGNAVGIQTSEGTNAWLFTSAGHLTPLGAFNIGDGVGNSPVNIYAENEVNVNGRTLTSGLGLNVGGGDKIGWSGQGGWFSPANSIIQALNHAGTDFTRLILGSNDANGIAIKKSTTDFQFKLGNDSAYANVDALGYKVGGVAGVSFGPAAVASITVVNGIVTAIS